MVSSNSSVLDTQKWADYLSNGEGVVSEHTVGLYDVLLTTDRVILQKKFPKSFHEVRYEDIHSLEHVTRINFSEILKAVVFFGLSVYAYILSPSNGSDVLYNIIKNIFKNYLPEFKDMPLSTIIYLLVGLLFALGLLHLIMFLFSTVGTLRISIKDKPPIRIQTPLTQEAKNLIKTIEERITGVKSATKPMAQLVTSAEGVTEVKDINKIRKQIEDEVKGLEKNAILVVSSKSEDHMIVVPSLLDLLISQKGQSGVYISISRPYEQIMKEMSKHGIIEDKLIFIDCISHMAGKVPEEKGNTVFVENPSSLEEIGMYADKLLMRLPEPKFIFLDSLDSLLIYNDEKSVKEFAHFMINKMRLDNIGGVILSIEKKEVEGLIKTLVPMCDKGIKL